jgi:ribosomal protein L37E
MNIFTLAFLSLMLLPTFNPTHATGPENKSPMYCSPPVRAQLCNTCGFGNKKDNCVKCGKWVGNSGVPARLCGDCGFGNKKDNCAKCGKWVASNGVPAQYCNSCGFGNKKDNCVKCGKWVAN